MAGFALFLVETSKVIETDLLPLSGIFQLVLQTGIGLLPTLLIDEGFGLVPDTDEILHLIHTTTIAVLHLLIDCAATLQAIGPRHTMEPQQITLRTGVDVVVERTIGLTVLGCGIGTSVGAVETDRVVVSLVVINRTPLDGITGNEAIGLRTIVLVEGEDMVQSDRHHIVDTSLTAAEHHVKEFRVERL